MNMFHEHFSNLYFYFFFFLGGGGGRHLPSSFQCIFLSFFVTSKSQGAHCFVHSLWSGTCTSHRLVSEPGAVEFLCHKSWGVLSF